ncbi:MAG: hypothetical protein KGJ69_11085 [Thermoplasmata archaeon]|nr:hypothetical protein [Thermoplasmata archaeon]
MASTESSIVITGGCTVPRQPVRETWVLDLSTEKWREGPPIPLPREGVAEVRDGDWLVTAGGYLPTSDTSPTVEALHLRELKWEARAPLPRPTAWARGARCGNAFHVAGGFRIDPRSADAAINDHMQGSSEQARTGAWGEASPLPMGVADGAFAPLPGGEKLVWTGGALGVGAWKREHLFSQPVTSATFAYDTFHQTWQRLQELPGARRAHRALPVKEGLVVAGGVDSETAPLSTAYLLAPDGIWSELEPLPQARYHFGLVEVGDEIWVLGGNYTEREPPPTLRVAKRDWLRA